MQSAITTTAVAIFDDQASADHAVRALREAGFSDEQIGVAVHKPAQSDDEMVRADEPMEHMGDGAGIGALAGASLGGIAGGTLFGLLAGGLAGGLVGALIGLGIPEAEAHYYQSQMEKGRLLVTVQSNGRFDEAMDIMREFNGRPAEPPQSRSGVGNLP